MNGEIVAGVTVGVALASLIRTWARGVRQDMNDLREEIGTTRRPPCSIDATANEEGPRGGR